MSQSARNVAVLGSTGSIGRNTLEVIAASAGQLQATALSAHANFDLLIQQAVKFMPLFVVATDADAAAAHDWSGLPAATKLLVGCEGLTQIVTAAETDVVVSAIVGSAGLRGTWAALEAGKIVALANKESLVMGGELVTGLVKKHGGQLLPVDSEHSAIFQCLQTGRRQELARVILTASGGPFRNLSREEMACVSIEQALNHPTWSMGRKVTIDSSTMMNKALEIIEARWLFDLAADQIAVVIHPQSIVHSLVEWADGSVVAQMSPPDMKLPIQYALTYPERRTGVAKKIDWARGLQLEFIPPDFERFPALELGLDAARVGGTTGAVLNAANEAAVCAFLEGELDYCEIVPACRAIVQHHNFEPHPTLERLLELDLWARQEVLRWVCT